MAQKIGSPPSEFTPGVEFASNHAQRPRVLAFVLNKFKIDAPDLAKPQQKPQQERGHATAGRAVSE
jgi:hypothetical protein